MTIAQWFDENGIENLPILNICVCRGMKKEDYESHLFLQDSVFEIEFVNGQGLLDKKQFEIPGYKNIREILIELTGLFSDFCHESSMITNLRYAGKIPRKHLSVNKRISNALGKLYATPEELAEFLEQMVSYNESGHWGSCLGKRKLLETAYCQGQFEHRQNDAVAAVRDALETDQKLIISDENVDRMLPSIYSMPDALFFAKQEAGLMADRFIRQHDCSVADNDQWNSIVEEYGRFSKAGD